MRHKMSVRELKELMRLNGWNQRELAESCGYHEAAASRWLSDDPKQRREPTAPAAKLLRLMLAEARAKREPVPA